MISSFVSNGHVSCRYVRATCPYVRWAGGVPVHRLSQGRNFKLSLRRPRSPPSLLVYGALSRCVALIEQQIRYAQKWELVGFGYRNLSIDTACTLHLHLAGRGGADTRDRARRDRQHATPCVLARRGGMRAAFRSCTVWASS